MEQTLNIEQANLHFQVSADNMAEQEQDDKIKEAVAKEQGRLKNFIRSRVSNEIEAEDILQDVFFQLTQTYRLMKPVEDASAWLFRVARNKITDVFRKNKPEPVSSKIIENTEEGESLSLLDILPSGDLSPEGEFIQNMIMEELDHAIEELPEEQSYIFIQNEVEGRSFKELSNETGLNVNTLISRKRYAVMYLRERLESIYNEFIYD